MIFVSSDNYIRLDMTSDNKIARINGKKPYCMVRCISVCTRELERAYYAMLPIGLVQVVVRYDLDDISNTDIYSTTIYDDKSEVADIIEKICSISLQIHVSKKQMKRLAKLCEDHKVWSGDTDIDEEIIEIFDDEYPKEYLEEFSEW